MGYAIIPACNLFLVYKKGDEHRFPQGNLFFVFFVFLYRASYERIFCLIQINLGVINNAYSCSAHAVYTSRVDSP
jgi:hypothetical protein